MQKYTLTTPIAAKAAVVDYSIERVTFDRKRGVLVIVEWSDGTRGQIEWGPDGCVVDGVLNASGAKGADVMKGLNKSNNTVTTMDARLMTQIATDGGPKFAGTVTGTVD